MSDHLDKTSDSSSVGGESMNGADLLIETAAALGIDTCFANPGTTELHLVDALGRADGMRTVLALFEGVVSGAADGYARIAGKPALGVFHLGPGFANSLANQHNARRHSTPMINVIGDQASWHLPFDAPLSSDIDALTGWTGSTRRITSAQDCGPAMREAIETSTTGNGSVANLIIPADFAWGSVADSDASAPTATDDAADPTVSELAEANPRLDAAVEFLRTPGGALIVGGPKVGERSMRLLGAIEKQIGCDVHLSRVARIEIGNDLANIGELPYFPEQLMDALAGVSAAVIVGREEPVTFFGYPGQPSQALPADAERLVLADAADDLEATLTALAARLGVSESGDRSAVTAGEPVPRPSGPLTAVTIGQAFAAAVQADAIVVAEAVSSGAGYRRYAPMAERHTLLAILGGAIGAGLPTAVGAAVAAPDRPVLCLQADGSGIYTIQSLWTMARENLDVTVVICANRTYKILEVELERAGMAAVGQAKDLVDLDRPTVEFTSLAAGFGVDAVQVDSCEGLIEAMVAARGTGGPTLIEAVME